MRSEEVLKNKLASYIGQSHGLTCEAVKGAGSKGYYLNTRIIVNKGLDIQVGLACGMKMRGQIVCMYVCKSVESYVKSLKNKREREFVSSLDINVTVEREKPRTPNIILERRFYHVDSEL